MNETKAPPLYRSHKEVHAHKIKAIELIDGGDGAIMITPAELGYSPFLETAKYAVKHQPSIGGYWVRYEDGYTSWSPAKAFEDGNTRVS